MSDSIRRPIPDAFPVKVVGNEAVVHELVPYAPLPSPVVGEEPARKRLEDTNVVYVTKTLEAGEVILTDVETGDRYKPAKFGAALVEPE